MRLCCEERDVAVMAAEKAEKSAATTAWYKAPVRRASVDDLVKATEDLHEVTKMHLLKLPSAKLSTAAILGSCFIYAVVFNAVDAFVLIFVGILNLQLLTATERYELWFKAMFYGKEAYTYVKDTSTWVQAEIAVKEKLHDESQEKALREKERERERKLKELEDDELQRTVTATDIFPADQPAAQQESEHAEGSLNVKS